MAYDPTNAVEARSYLEDAIGLTSEPTLAPEQVDRAFNLAATLDSEGVVTYPEASLNRAAAWAWGVKAGLTADRYDLGGGSGSELNESQWHAHCKAMQRDYKAGLMSVVGEDAPPRRGIGSIGLTSSLAETETI